MIQVWVLDEYGFFTDESKFVEEVTENMTTVPLLVGYVKPKFNGREWMDGATDEEIKAWEEANKIDICPTKTVEERLEETEQRLAEKDQENKMLKAQVEANASSYEFLESCIMEMAEKVYA